MNKAGLLILFAGLFFYECKAQVAFTGRFSRERYFIFWWAEHPEISKVYKRNSVRKVEVHYEDSSMMWFDYVDSLGRVTRKEVIEVFGKKKRKRVTAYIDILYAESGAYFSVVTARGFYDGLHISDSLILDPAGRIIEGYSTAWGAQRYMGREERRYFRTSTGTGSYIVEERSMNYPNQKELVPRVIIVRYSLDSLNRILATTRIHVNDSGAFPILIDSVATAEGEKGVAVRRYRRDTNDNDCYLKEEDIYEADTLRYTLKYNRATFGGFFVDTTYYYYDHKGRLIEEDEENGRKIFYIYEHGDLLAVRLRADRFKKNAVRRTCYVYSYR